MFRTFARASQEASGVDGVMRQRNNPRIRLSTAAVRCRRTFTYHADGQLASASCDGIGRAHTPGAPQTETCLYWAYEVWTSTVIYFDPEATNYIGAIKAPSTTTSEWKEYVE